MSDLDPEEEYSTTEVMVDEDSSSTQSASQIIEQEKRLAANEGLDTSAEAFAGRNSRVIAARDNSYTKRRFDRTLSPERVDPFNQSHSGEARSYREVLAEAHLARDEATTMQQIRDKFRKEHDEAAAAKAAAEFEAPPQKRQKVEYSLEAEEGSRWDATPQTRSSSDSFAAPSSKSSSWDATPSAVDQSRRSNRWDQTPASNGDATTRRRARWDETPAAADPSATPAASASMQTPSVRSGAPSLIGSTGAASAFSQLQLDKMTPEQIMALRIQQDVEARNQPWSDAELDALLPSDGFEVVPPPANYKPLRTPSRKLLMTPTPMGSGGADGYAIPATPGRIEAKMAREGPDGIPFTKLDDEKFFGKLLEEVDESQLSKEEQKERLIMTLLLKVKNGTPPQRKSALRQLSAEARTFGAKALFDQILPLLRSPTLEDQERHLLVKVIDRVLYKLDDLVRPYVHKILVVIEPMLIDEDYYARCEGREIISNLTKAAGLATMIATMRPDIDHPDEYVRNTTSRAFAVVASALGIGTLLPFLKAVCKSKRSWEARHTGIKIVQQIAIMMGCAVLPHLTQLVEIIAEGLNDEQIKVKCITGLALSALADAAHPYGFDSFDPVLKPLWQGIKVTRGKVLAAFLKAIGSVIPLMHSDHANAFTKEVCCSTLSTWTPFSQLFTHRPFAAHPNAGPRVCLC